MSHVHLTAPQPPPGAPAPSFPIVASAALGLLLAVTLALSPPTPMLAVGMGVVAFAAVAELLIRGALRERRRRDESAAARLDFERRLDEAMAEELAGLVRGCDPPRARSAVVGSGAVVSAVQVGGEAAPRILERAPLVAPVTRVRLFAPPALSALLPSLLRLGAETVVEVSPPAAALGLAVPPETVDVWVGPDGMACARAAGGCGGAWTALELGAVAQPPADRPVRPDRSRLGSTA